MTRALSGVAACLSCGHSLAAEWSFQPAFSWHADHQSNRRLSPDAEPSQSTWLILDTTFKRATETQEVSVRPRLELQRFSDNELLNSEEGALQSSYSYRAERYLIDLTANWSRDSTMTSELAETGLVDTSTYRESLSTSIAARRQLTMRQQITGRASYLRVEYPEGLRFGLTGYRYPSLSGSYEMGVGPRTSVGLTGYGSELTSQYRPRSRDLGLQLTAEHDFSPALHLSAAFGISQTELGRGSDRGDVWSLYLSHVGELTRWTASYDRSVAPSGVGTLVRREELKGEMRRSLSPRFSVRASLYGVRNEDLVFGLFLDERRYIAGDVGLEWRTSEQWVTTLRVGENEAQHPSAHTSVNGWTTELGFRWTPVRWSRSR